MQGVLKTVYPNSFKSLSLLLVNLNDNTRETCSFVLKLQVCHLDGNFLANIKFDGK